MKIIFLLIISGLFTTAVLGQKTINNVSLRSEQLDTTAFNSAGADSDTVNISQMVAAQIDAARKKEEQINNNPAMVIQSNITQNTKPASLNLYDELKTRFSIPEDVMMKASILATASFISAAVIFIRRRKSKRKKQPANKNLKENIKSLREEKVQIKGSSKLSGVRNRLAENTPAYNLTQGDISRTAKRLNISKEEILLAQRLKRMR
ncbi:MAG TPA: hypothetical protein VMV36_00500 [Ignavibacteriaceae bacterium]|nr:hypothetical protein [Ignavibacteriaceae bacterium]